ncbi:MAG: Cof-type HAD-IIB family hydrolase [Cellulophaga fucicola]
MTYKILCSDLDGTLLTTKNDVSEVTISEINRIKKHLKVILVSARMPKSMRYLQERLGIENLPIICYNGALVLDNDKELFSTFIGSKELQTIHTIAEQHTVKLGLYFKDEWYVPQDSERVQKEIHHTKAEPIFEDTQTTLTNWEERGVGAHKIMLMGTKETTDAIFTELTSLLGDTLHFYRSNDTLIEVAPKTISKLSAIELLLKDETLEDVIAFGDNYNDMEMLANVGCGVAVGNGRDEVKKIAKHTTLKNTENGVAHFIKQNILI